MLNHAHLPGHVDFRTAGNPHGLRFVEGDDGNGGGADGNNTGGSGGGDGKPGGGNNNAAGDADGGGSNGGSDKGFPADTPVAEMTPEQQSAYWRDKARKHEGLWKGLVGDRKPDDVKSDLAEYAKIQHEKLTPSEQAIKEAEARGRQAAAAESAHKTVDLLFRTALKGAEVPEADIDEMADTINPAKFLTKDGDVDIDKVSRVAKRLARTDTEKGKKDADYGAGRRGHGSGQPGSAGLAEAQKRFGKPA